jgi:drug/metabolite transporter (DMT)-like permease
VPLSAFVLVLVAGLIHASWNIAAKKAGGDVRFAAFTSAVNTLAWAPIGWWVAREQLPSWGAREWLLVAASALIHCGYFVMLLRGYRKADLTVVYPLARGSGPLLSSFAAILLLGETISALGLTGILAVAAGVFLIAGGPSLWRGAHEPAQRQRIHKGMLYGVVTGAFIAGYTLVDGYAVKVLLLSPILFDYMSNLLRLVLMSPTVLRDVPAAAALWRRQWKYALYVGIISPMAYVLVLYAMQMAPLSHVAPAREVSMLFAALLGGHLLGEGDRLPRALGAALIAGGVIALAVG